ncbi:MAG TPA: serine/threonine-protein kinase, partial [Gemmataceae bacterium]|nr:serine/threonine-protein kinase [Gemmataceae bacterium]
MTESRTSPQTPVITAEVFLRAILRSGIIDRPTLQAALGKVPVEMRRDPDALAEELIHQGKLTRFQAGKLLRGMSVGLILGPYQVLAPLGRGGMGTVYLARDARSQMLVALKVLPPKRAREEERLLARFRREMDMCQRVSHPHLAWAYEVGVCQGVYYIALEYIPGKSLFRLVTEEGPLSVPRAARLFGEVCSALDHAHNQGLIHRDMKPSNIMITPHDRAKVLDLGLALVQGEAPADREVVGGQGYVVGTMDYIAPEQAENAAMVGTS